MPTFDWPQSVPRPLATLRFVGGPADGRSDILNQPLRAIVFPVSDGSGRFAHVRYVNSGEVGSCGEQLWIPESR